jgi:hypothetical protein
MRINFKHRYSAHCESGCVAGLLQHDGIAIDEAMVFGIGSGLYFGHFPFLKVGLYQLTTFRNLPGSIFKTAVGRLGLDLHVRRFGNEQKAMDELDALLERGIPVGVQLGVYWLPYMPPPQRLHFNTHNAVVIGREGDDYLLSDITQTEPVSCPRAALQKARFAKGLMAPKGCMYHVEPGSKIAPDIAPMVRVAVRAVCSQMTTWFPMVGVRGIRLLAKNLGKWKRNFKDPDVRRRLSDVIVMQEMMGTGGGGFRFMYSAFLKEAGDRTGNPRLSAMAEPFLESGKRWRTFAETAHHWCKNRMNPGESYETLPRMLEDIADREQKALGELRAAVN